VSGHRERAPHTLLSWGEQAAGNAAAETGDDDYHRVSSHDCRRYWANHLLVEEGISPAL
jgi:integrase